MAAQPNKPAPVNQVLADLNKRYGTGPVTAAPVAPKKDTTDYSKVQLGTQGSSSDPNKQDPVSFIIDMLSRPLYAVTDAAVGQSNAITALKQGKSPNMAVDALLKNNGFTGFFSTDKANKNTTSTVIEKITDNQGSLDPNYVNRKDNVNPILKGVAGFAGDILLDPTTYIPGAVIAKGLNIGLKAVKGLKTGVEAGVITSPLRGDKG